MTTTYTTSLNLPKQATGDNPNTWGTVLNGGLDQLDAAFGATTTLALTNANVSLTQSQCDCRRFLLTGVLAANLTVTIPNNAALTGVSGEWFVDNQTSGAYTVTFASVGGGSSVKCAQGMHIHIFCDGTNVVASETGAVQWAGTAGGTANAITLTPAVPIIAYAVGQRFQFLASAANSGATTVAISGLGAVNVTKAGATALQANDIGGASVLCDIVYDGTEFQLLGPWKVSTQANADNSTNVASTAYVDFAVNSAVSNGVPYLVLNSGVI